MCVCVCVSECVRGCVCIVHVHACLYYFIVHVRACVCVCVYLNKTEVYRVAYIYISVCGKVKYFKNKIMTIFRCINLRTVIST